MNFVLSLLMLTALALVGGAVFLWRRGVRKQAALMVVLAAAILVNVLIWTVPDRDGQTLAEQAEGAG